MDFRCLLSAMGLAVCGVCASFGAEELLKNGSFEDVVDGRTPGWSVGRHWSFEAGCGMNGTRGLAFENTDEKDFYEYPSQAVPFETGKRYHYSVMVKTEDLTGNAAMCVEWYDADGKWLSGSYQGGFRGTHDWTKIEGVTPPIPAEAAKVRLAFFIGKGGFGKAWFDDVSFRLHERAVFGGLYCSAYRNLAREGAVRFHAAINVAEHPGAKATFSYVDAAGASRRVAATRMTKDAAVLEIDAAHLAYGTHPVTCELTDVEGRKLGGESLDFTRPHELPKRRTWIDGRGRTIIDGKPFFPVGIYLAGVPKTGAQFGDFLTGPFNCVMPYNCDREGLDICRHAGIEVIYPLNSCWSWHKFRPKGVETDADADAWVEKKVAEIKDHPAVMAWYVNDEIGPEKLPQLRSRQKLIERVDPGHPTWTVLYQFGEVRSYYPTFDVIGTDPYPIPGSPVGNVSMWTRTTREETMGLKPMWQVPQAFGWGDFDPKKAESGRFPTRKELLNMTWQCVANGANGIVYWCYRLLYQNGKFRVDRWADICMAAASVKSYVPVFLSDEDEPEVVGTNEELSARAWRYRGDTYLAVVNNTRKTVTGKLKTTVDKGAVLQRLFGSDGCTLTKEGTVEVEIPGLGVEFVRLGSAWR